MGIFVSSCLKFDIDGETAALVGWLGEPPAGDVSVPSHAVVGGCEYEVTAVRARAFADCADIASVTLPASIESVEEDAFVGCASLQSIVVNAGNEVYASFDGMLFDASLTTLLLIPEGKEGAARIPDQTVLVPNLAFSRNAHLSTVLVGEGNGAFSSRDGILYSKDLSTLVYAPSGMGEAVVLPPETRAIGAGAFAGAETLRSIVATGSVEDIDPTAFADAVKREARVALAAGDGFDALKAVWEKAGFQKFETFGSAGEEPEGGEGPSQSAEAPEEGSAQEGELQESAHAGPSFELLANSTLAVSWQGEDGPGKNLEIPASAEVDGVTYPVSAVADRAFEGCSSIESVSVPSSVKSVGDAAFSGCSSLAAVSLSEGLESIGAEAFEGTAIEGLRIPSTVGSIGARAFADCAELARIVAHSDPWVDDTALAGCAGVSVYCPANEAEEYPWNVGLVANGNHLLPYGVSLLSEPIELEVGQEADLFEGGSGEEVEGTELFYAYAASSVSVDGGIVKAKAEGTADVAVALSLDGEVLSRASRSVEVVAASAESETDNLEVVEIEPLAANAPTKDSPQKIGTNCQWYIADNGMLVIGPESGYTKGTLPDFVSATGAPWHAIAGGLSGVRILEGVAANTYCDYMFADMVNAENILVTRLDTSKCTRMIGMFSNCSKIAAITLEGWDTSKVTNMAMMFKNCSKLKSLNVYYFDTGSLQNMYQMFYDCKALDSFTLNSFNTSSVTNMEGTFYGCEALKAFSFPNFDTSKVTNMRCMFMNCSNLTGLDISTFKTSSVTEMDYMFNGCASLTNLVLPSSMDTSKVRNMRKMFADCSSLTSSSLACFTSTASVVDYRAMFQGCVHLSSLTLPDGFISPKITSADPNMVASMFNGCSSLVTIPKNLVFGNYALPSDVFSVSGLSSPLRTYYNGTDPKLLGTAAAALNYNWGNSGRAMNTYAVTLDGNGATTAGTGSVNAQYGLDMPAVAKLPDRTGYTFTGYYDAKIGGTQYYGADGSSTRVWDKGESVLYAQWTGIEYKVTLNKNGGSGGSDSVNATYGSAMPGISVPSWTGRTFLGYWDTSAATGGNQYYSASGASVRNWDKAGTATLYARWSANTYKVTLNKNGGSGGSDSVNATYGSPMPKIDELPTMIGWTFSGYIDGSGKLYYKKDGTSNNNWDKAQDATLTALWARNWYSVILDKNGGAGGTELFTAEYGSPMPKIDVPSWTGRTFLGYWDAKTGGKQYFKADGTSANDWDKTNVNRLYAQWKANPYKVTFDSNGGSSVAQQNVDCDTTVPQPKDPTWTGYDFKGWYADKALTVPWIFADDVMPPNDMTLYAKWTPHKYNVVFNSKGGTALDPVPVAYKEKVPAPEPPTQPGYVFSAWFQDAELETVWDFTQDTMPAKDLVLYAKWEPRKFPVTWGVEDGEAGGTVDPEGASENVSYNANPTAKVKAVPAVPEVGEGYSFVGWKYRYLPAGAEDKPENYVEGTIADYRSMRILGPTSFTAVFKKQPFVSVSAWDGYVSIAEGAEPAPVDKLITDAVEFDEPLSAGAKQVAISLKPRDNYHLSTLTVNDLHGNSKLVYTSIAGSSPSSDFTMNDSTLTVEKTLDEKGGTLVIGNIMNTLNVNATFVEDGKQTVAFNAQGGSPEPVSQALFAGGYVARPADPERENHTFMGWYKDSACTEGNEWDFDRDTVGGTDLVLYARWRSDVVINVAAPLDPEIRIDANGDVTSRRDTVFTSKSNVDVRIAKIDCTEKTGATELFPDEGVRKALAITMANRIDDAGTVSMALGGCYSYADGTLPRFAMQAANGDKWPGTLHVDFGLTLPPGTPVVYREGGANVASVVFTFEEDADEEPGDATEGAS